MPRGIIPERDSIGDLFDGYVQQVANISFLTRVPQPDVPQLAHGALTIRYGLRFLEKPHIAIVPGLVALDYGDFLTGEEAWEFLLQKSNLYPRSDVLGYRNDGMDEMIPIKWLDIAQPPQVLAYTSPDAAEPITEIHAMILTDTDQPVAERILQYVPVFPTLTAMQQSLDAN